MEPDSIVLVVALVLLAAGAFYLVARQGRWWWKAVGATLAFVLAVGVGVATVNDYYGYYTSWGQLTADLSGDSGAAFTDAVTHRGTTAVGQGRLEALDFAGPRSGINREGLIYLPPQYFQARYADTRFPVVELLHGTPGSPSQYPVQLQLVELAHHLLANREAGPMIYVMPDISGHHFQECVDAPGALDDTYVTQDVRADVLARYRAATDPAEWGVAGFSSGGYCAANLAMRHPADFGAAGLMDAYYRPQDGPAAAALHDNRAAERANDPLLRAAALTEHSSPLPAFWISAGTGVHEDIAGARAFIAALHGVEQVTFEREPGAGHNFYAWRTALPPLLAWMWTQLAPPSLRVQYPVAGAARVTTLPVIGHPVPLPSSESSTAPSAPPSESSAPRPSATAEPAAHLTPATAEGPRA